MKSDGTETKHVAGTAVFLLHSYGTIFSTTRVYLSNGECYAIEGLLELPIDKPFTMVLERINAATMNDRWGTLPFYQLKEVNGVVLRTDVGSKPEEDESLRLPRRIKEGRLYSLVAVVPDTDWKWLEKKKRRWEKWGSKMDMFGYMGTAYLYQEVK